ncbi:diadenylate cyclase [Pilibacter termitis]|uniref:Diadenylate cyclase n=1 Tax=Pilibacter termitis TaxID=263852 RepID=A0A1T4PZU1_9ENTE|nr:diadenylate cyclase CdaA [Pilibacter termitis]SJZ97052.1 diadenylate cyclase [Pilibacter termitis]
MDFSQIFTSEFWRNIFSDNIFSLHFFVNILDVLVVWFLIYKLVQMLQGTKAIQLIKGVVLFFVIRVLSEMIGLTTITWVMNQVITYGVIAGIVIFQPEVRKALEQLGQSANLKMKKDHATEHLIDSYKKAVEYMSKRKIGALITIERERDLSEYISTGIPLDADISGELLINIFIPNTPLHDGAVIVREGKVVVSCAYLPLTENINIPKEYGTRHRAAIGISEVSDALTIVVSEETGGISITKSNQFLPHLDMETFENILRSELMPKEVEEKLSLFQQLERNILKKKRGGKA